ncbi:LysR family transcriptional regulator [Bradyrhizobium brasilense]|uniref:LysR family transcriptional regulator n=1 Tax=Bradyrhizobium brasilense TaxID=1419277 RepID=UPI001E288264|nr:LysR family transcriptional regulator [Bradyrhizobium brasilense]MCC8971577.1 LysR family transcriptional regulator [Bradyrhizobium brasilense]
MSTPVDRLNLMRLFVHIAEIRSLSGAGRLLGLSQPSTSRQLKQLETTLGVELFQRSTHELALTEAGKQFLPTAMEMLAVWDGAVENARAGRDKIRGNIRVAVPVAIGQTILAEIAMRFLAEHRGITLDWRLIDEPGDLAAGGYDLWIRAGPIRDESLIVHELRRSHRTIVGYTAEKAVQHPTELNRRPAVQLVTYMALQIPLETDDGRATTLTLKPALATDNIYVALMGIRSGIGYGILPHWLVQEDLEAGTLIELCPGWHPPAISLHIAYPQSRFRTARVKLFIEYLRRELVCLDSNAIFRTGTSSHSDWSKQTRATKSSGGSN